MSDFYSGISSSTLDNTTEKEDFKLPPENKVIFYNDNFTTMDFVVNVLMSIFNKSYDEAYSIMIKIHNEGTGTVGEYTHDIAISKKQLTIQIARENGFPLRVEIE